MVIRKISLLILIVSVFYLADSFTFFNSDNKSKNEKILGADISFLPQLENRGIKFSDDGVEKDAIQILKDHGFNYIRLRIFHDPAADSGYSPKKGFCDLDHTKAMALRIKKAKMKFLLDFHYSDTWADPGKQFKPSAWKTYDFAQLKNAVYMFTKKVIAELRDQGTPPDMVQIGNEINHGMIWPDGSFSHPDTLAELIKEGIRAAKEVSPATKIMLHIACGGQNTESTTFIDAMLARKVQFDIVGESYYPRWHGTLGQLDSNLTDLAKRYKQDVVVAEYTEHKKEVNDIEFNLPNNKGIGTFIWEPLNTWEQIFDKKGMAKDSLLNIYSDIKMKYKIQ
jgi:arabinogalactan endo-1,4-beta-galactosidase